VIVTEGKEGCRLYWDGGEARVAPFSAVQVDPTGAGDSYLAGFAAGLLWGLSATDAALIGNFFGAAAVSQIGVPTFHPEMLQVCAHDSSLYQAQPKTTCNMYMHFHQ
jgi:1D-myo-inositol 3-kinase